jgi:hypothetical protein
MRSLLWKEWRENFKWVPLPALLILGPIGLFGMPPIMDEVFLIFVALVAAGFGATLGFVQIFFESSGDKRALLLHRPLGRTQIFLGKSIVGVCLYLLALSLPFACVMRLAATPGHVPQPFDWPMVLPWLADALTGLVFYFAGMLAAGREARWYGSRFLGLAAGLSCGYLVWTLPEFWQALLAIILVGGLVGMAAWGSFHSGGAFAPQPRLAKVALSAIFIMGLLAISFTGKVFVGFWLWTKTGTSYRLDRQGQVLRVQKQIDGMSVTDLQGKVPPEIANVPLDTHALSEITAPWARGRWPKTQSYRSSNRALVKYGNNTQPGNEWWWYVPSQGRLVGYDKPSFQPIGSFGPAGFAGPGQKTADRFSEELIHVSRAYSSWADDYLTFPNAVYKVDFRKRIVRSIFTAGTGETVHWASRWENENLKLAIAFVCTNQAIHIADDAGSRPLSLPLAKDLEGYEVGSFGRLENPTRYWVWYEPAWYLDLAALETMPAWVLTYDDSGREVSSRQLVAPCPGFAREIKPRMPPVEASASQAWLGLLTSPAEAAILLGTTNQLLSDVRRSQGTEIDFMLEVLFATTQHFIPGVRWYPPAHWHLVYGFGALMLLSAALSSILCFVQARRHAFPRSRCIGWAILGFCLGWAGFALMLALHEWPARIPCPACRKIRVVARDRCEHCGAAHATPAPDGTEVFEDSAAATGLVASVG